MSTLNAIHTEEQKEKMRQWRKQQYRVQKVKRDAIKQSKREAQRKEKDEQLWSLLKTANELKETAD